MKPSNVIVTDEDRIKVLDFGLATLLDPADRAAEARTRTSPATEVGIVVGSTAYLSPEQAEGRRIGSDVFSFGAVLYEMITRRRPFVGDSQLSVLAKILNEDAAPPSIFARSLSPDVERTILRCLRKDPARRFQTMADLKVALEDLEADSAAAPPAQASATRVSRRWRWAWAALLPVVLIAAYLMSQSGRTAEPTAPLRAVPLTVLPGVMRYPSFSPDGTTWRSPGPDRSATIPTSMFNRSVPAVRLRLTTDVANDYSPVWSPDGRAIGFLRQQADRAVTNSG